MPSALRDSMTNLILRLRRLISDGLSTVWADDELQEVLDQNRRDFYQEPLLVVPRQVAAGSVTYTVYRSRHCDLEEYASADPYAFRLFDSTGVSVGTANPYTADYINGIITFTNNQAGTAFYLDGRSYDLNGAAAHCWGENAGLKAERYDFQTQQQRFSRSQWFEHCQKMIQYYESSAWPKIVNVVRGDTVPGEPTRRAGLRTARTYDD